MPLKPMPRTAFDWMRSRRQAAFRWGQFLLPSALLVLAVWMRAGDWGWVESARHMAFDTLLRLRPRPYEPVPVRVLDIDDETLSRLGQWPWPRNLVARVVNRLTDLGASVIVFDVVFAEPDRTSPSRIVSLWPDAPELKSLRARAKTLPDHDRIFAKALSESNVVLGFALTSEANDVQPQVKAAFSQAGDDPLPYLQDFAGAVAALPVLEKAAAGVGFFSFVPDRDGIIRRAPLLSRRGDAILPSLSAEALRLAQGARNIAIKSSGGNEEVSYAKQHTGISRVKIGSYIIPTDGAGRVWVYYTLPTPERTVPIWRIFEKDFDPAKLSGSILFIGTSASGLKDLRATPLNPAAPGVETHANLTEQVLLKKFLQRPDWATGAEVAYMAVMGLALIILLPRLGAAWCAPLGFVGIAGALGVSWRAYTAWGRLIDPVFPCLTVLLIYLSSSLISYLRTEADKHQIKGAFSRYMSPTLVDQLAKHPEKLKLGGESRIMTFHFCDLQGFSTLSEFYDPEGLTHFLNRFLTPMTDIILQHNGVIDKYIGDCIMAYWNAPLDDPDHAKNACVSVVEMHERLRTLNEEWRREAEEGGKKYHAIRLRTGLNTGPCICGNMGSDQRFDYSVLGDDVNTASRLEGANKFFHSFIMVSESTMAEAGDAVVARELGRIRVVGKAVPIKVFNLLAKKGELSGDWAKALPAYEGGLELFSRRKFSEAADRFKDVLEVIPDDGPASTYLKFSQDYLAKPPAADWDGVFNLTAK